MSDRPAYVAVILAAPDDDAPRLALADRLERHGTEADRARAAFVRLQCQLAGLPADDPRREPLAKHARQLERQGRPAWLAGLPGFVRRGVFVRGFVEHVEAAGVEFLRHIEAVWQREPVRSAALRDPRAAEALAHPLAARLARVVVRPPVDEGAVILKFPGR